MKIAARLLLGIVACTMAAAPALADDDDHRHRHRHKHKEKNVYVERNVYVQKNVYVQDWRGGPPPWAPAHGYRRQMEQPQGYMPSFDIGSGGCNRDLIGGILGAAAGGLLGAQIGDGRGQLAATAAGTVAGMLLGANIGRGFDRTDRMCMGQALEYAPENQPVVWQGSSGGEYRMVPVRTYQSAGTYCREYQSVITVGGRRQQGYGTACRQPDGSWQVAN